MNILKILGFKTYFGIDGEPASSGGGGTAMLENAKPSGEPASGAPAPLEPPKVENMKSDEIKSLLEKSTPAPEQPAKPEVKQADPNDRSTWFDPDRGFKTKEDAVKSYGELQEKLRQQSVQLKELEQREKIIIQQQEEIRQRNQAGAMSEEDKQKQAALERWKLENSDALNFIKQEIKKDMEVENSRQTFEQQALKARNDWKAEFDKEESRKVLWPVMEEIFKEKDIFQEFAKNPLPFIEALAFQKNFGTIAAQIKAEAVSQFKAELSKANEAERVNSTANPGGLKTPTGEVDVSKMSSTDIGALLPRNDNG